LGAEIFQQQNPRQSRWIPPASTPDVPERAVNRQLVERHWLHYFLHNQRGAVLKALLFVKGNQRISVINVPWYLTV